VSVFHLRPLHNAEQVLATPVQGNTESVTDHPYEKWNEMLRRNVQAFLSENEDVTTMVLSSFDFFNLVLETPSEYGFEEKDIRRRYGPVWADHIHPTSRMHELLAERINEFLRSFPASETAQAD